MPQVMKQIWLSKEEKRRCPRLPAMKSKFIKVIVKSLSQTQPMKSLVSPRSGSAFPSPLHSAIGREQPMGDAASEIDSTTGIFSQFYLCIRKVYKAIRATKPRTDVRLHKSISDWLSTGNRNKNNGRTVSSPLQFGEILSLHLLLFYLRFKL